MRLKRKLCGKTWLFKQCPLSGASKRFLIESVHLHSVLIWQSQHLDQGSQRADFETIQIRCLKIRRNRFLSLSLIRQLSTRPIAQ